MTHVSVGVKIRPFCGKGYLESHGLGNKKDLENLRILKIFKVFSFL